MTKYFILLSLILLFKLNLVAQEAGSDSILVNKAIKAYQRGLNFYFENGFDSAEYYLISAQEFFFKDQNWENMVRANLGLMLLYNKSGEYEKYRKISHENYAIANQYLGEATQLYTLSLNNLASYYFIVADYEKAIQIYLDVQLRFSIDKAKNCENMYKVLRSIGTSYQKVGDFHNSLKSNYSSMNTLEACDLLPEEKKQAERAIVLINIGAIQSELKDFSNAKENLSEAIEILKNTYPNIHQRTDYLRNAYYELADVFLNLNKFEELNHLLPILDSLEKVSSKKKYQLKYQILSDLNINQGNYAEAEILLKETHQLRCKYFENRPDHPRLAESMYDLLKVQLILHKYDTCLLNAKEALEYCYFQNSPYPLIAVPILDAKAQALIGRYHQNIDQSDLDSAFWCYLAADSLIDSARDRLQNKDSKLFFSQKSRPIYERAIHFCLMMYKKRGDPVFLEKAFYFSEQSKATLLFQSLQDTGAKLAAGLPDSLLKKEHDLKVDIAFYQNKIFEAERKPSKVTSTQLIEWRQILFDSEEAFRRLTKALEEQYTDYYQLKYEHKIITAMEVQRKLKRGQLLIEFFEGDSTIFLFAIGKKGMQVHEIRHDTVFDQQLDGLLRSLQQPQKGLEGLQNFTLPAHTIYKQLLAPVLSGQDVEHLIIVPDGQLSYLPFELLLQVPVDIIDLDDRYAERQFRNLPYLFRDAETRYAYSATLLLANPYQPKAYKHEMAAFAPAYTGNLFLAYNQPQAEAVARLMGGRVFKGPQADKQIFLQNAPDYRVLHLAMHGEPNLYSPLRSRFLFAGEDTAKASSLFAYELYNLKLNAQLTVLAACESGYGKLEQGEGIYSLARAFRFAGCPSIVSSLWKADGQATQALMEAFYEELDNGSSKAAALQTARVTYLVGAPNGQLHPYYWANFVMIGDNTPIDGQWSWWWFVLGFILIGGFLGRSFIKFSETLPQNPKD